MYTPTLFAAATAGLVSLAAATCTETDGNWYCNQVDAVSYFNFGGSGTYNRVTNMDESTGACTFASAAYGPAGSIAPFDEELSIHIQGPFYLKQFAFYQPSSSSSKRDEAELAEVYPALEARSTTTSPTCPGSNSSTYTSNGKVWQIECGFDRPGNIGMTYQSSFQACIDTCAQTANCVDVSYVSGGGACYQKASIGTPNMNSGVYGARLVSSATGSSSTSAASSTSSSSTKISTAPTTLATSTSTKTSTTPTTLATSTKPTSSSTSIKSSSTTTQTSTSTKATSTSQSSTTHSSTSTPSPSATAVAGSWSRNSYYSSTAGTAQNVAFLNTMGGGTVSGVWSSAFGSSLSYASSDGTQAASSPQVLSDMTLASTTQIAIFAGQTCASDNGCGYYRNGTVAYHGFGGANKIFLFEFSMPNSGGNNQPALWMLNALIPRYVQRQSHHT